MEAKVLGWLQIVGAALALWFNRSVFELKTGPGIALAIMAVLFLIMGLHHLSEKKGKKH